MSLDEWNAGCSAEALKTLRNNPPREPWTYVNQLNGCVQYLQGIIDASVVLGGLGTDICFPEHISAGEIWNKVNKRMIKKSSDVSASFAIIPALLEEYPCTKGKIR